jgi:nucleoid-associated protein YgaU
MTRGRILVFSSLTMLFASTPAGSKPKPPEAVPYDDHALEQMMKQPQDEEAMPPTAPLKIQEPDKTSSPAASSRGSMDSPLTTAGNDEKKPRTRETYKVYIWQENGDTLWRIAQKVYGDKEKWPLIYNANRDILQDPNKIYPRQVLKIPPLNEEQ